MKTSKVTDVHEFSYGTNFVIEGTIEGPNGKAVTIITVWFIKTEKSRPSFVTAYPV